MRRIESIHTISWISSAAFLLSSLVFVGITFQHRSERDRERASLIEENEGLKAKEESLRNILEQVSRTRAPVVCECAGGTGPSAPQKAAVEAAGTPAVEKAAPSESPESQRAASDVALLIDRASAAGQWTAEEAATFRSHLGEMSAVSRQDAISRLIQLINSGALKVDVKGPPF